MICFKKVREMKDGNYYPLFIDKTRPFVLGQKMESKFCPKKGFAPRSINGFGENAVGGWHMTPSPNAPWIHDELANGEKRVWLICEAEECTQYMRPQGIWYLAHYMTPVRVINEQEIKDILEQFNRWGTSPNFQNYLKEII